MLVSLGCRISRWVDENRCWSAIPFREFGSPPDVRLPFNPIYFLRNKPCGLIPITCVSCKQLPLISSSLAFSWSFSAIILIDNSDHRFPHVFSENEIFVDPLDTGRLVLWSKWKRRKKRPKGKGKKQPAVFTSRGILLGSTAAGWQ